jgi:predicted transcriptional regulator
MHPKNYLFREEYKKQTKSLTDQVNGLKGTIAKSDKESTQSAINETLSWDLRLNNLGKIADNAGNSLKGSFDFISEGSGKAFGELDTLGTEIQHSFGVSKERLDEFRFSIAETSPELIKMGLSQQKATDNFIAMSKELGTAASIGNEAIIEMSAAAELTGQDVSKLTAGFREVGVSIYDVGDQMKDVANYAKSVGVSVSAVSAGVVGNLGKMNLYNFEGGIKGLTSMAAQAARLGISMDTVFGLSEKLMDPEQAIDMSAALQRLGVTSSALLDPLKAMDLAQNDPEALQKEMVNISKEFTKFNEASGKMEIMPGAKRRLREVAKELGMNADELAKMSINAADFDKKMSQIEFPELAQDKETKEMIASMAQLKDGKAMINIKNEQTGEVELKQVGQLTGKDIESLKMSQEESGKSVEQLAIDQLDELKQIKGLMDGTLKAAEYGKATTPALSKLFYGLKGVEKSVAQRTSDEVTTKGVRKTVGGLTQPVEDLAVATFKGDAVGQAASLEKLVTNASDLSAKGVAMLESIANGVLKDTKDILAKAYMEKPTTKTELTINANVKVEGDANTKNMNKEEITNAVLQGIQNPTSANAMTSALAGGTAPTATTGAKNL